MNGKVILIGAGPGDPGLLTLKGRRLLAEADVVVYDRLVGAEILAMMPDRAEKINVGKNSGRHPVPQHEINQILLGKALEGKTVVRLKGGDCFLFGRGGEELELLAEHGVSFEVVPGVPSPIAATAYAGIPVTHRDFCASVHFITGHRREDGTLNLDYGALVRLNGTLVFLMSVATCGEIAEGLIAAGMQPDMDCAVIENGTRANQRKFVATVGSIERTVEENHVVSPALIVVGRVCRLSDEFDWFSSRPLFGRRILVTAPAASGSRLAEKLRARGADVTVCPVIETVPLDFVPPELSGFRAAVFTSAFGVRTFFTRLFAAGRDARVFSATKIAAIGSGTAAALREFGLTADLVPDSFHAEALAKSMLETGMVRPGDRIALLRAKDGNPVLGELLRAGGAETAELPIYETRPLPYEGAAPDTFDYVTFTSASGAESFAHSCSLGGFTDLSRIRALCIGAQTAAAADRAGFLTCQSNQATLDSMADYLEEAFS